MKLNLSSFFAAGLLAAGPVAGALAQVEHATPQAQAPAAAPQPAPPRPFQVAYLRVGVGTTFDAMKYYRCTRLAVEYAPMLTRQVGLAARLVGVAGKPTGSGGPYGPWIDQLPNQNYKAGYAEGEVLFYPFGNERRVRFAVGAGGFAGYYKKNDFDFVNVVDNRVVDYLLAEYHGAHAGYLGSLNLDVALGQQQRWLVGLKTSLQKGVGGVTDLPAQSLTVSRRL